MEHGRKKWAATQAVHTITDSTNLSSSRLVEPPHKPHMLDRIRLLGLRVVSWDGM